MTSHRMVGPVAETRKPFMEQVAREMEQVAEYRARVPQGLRMLYAPVREELRQVEQILCDELRSDHPFVEEAGRTAH